MDLLGEKKELFTIKLKQINSNNNTKNNNKHKLRNLDMSTRSRDEMSREFM